MQEEVYLNVGHINNITEDNGMICYVCENALCSKAVGLSCCSPARIILEYQ